MARPSVRYGTINTDLVGRWLAMAPDDDGAFWAVNFMRYREVADYGDDETEAPRSGIEADNEYSPTGPLAAIGARIAFVAPVVEQVAGTPEWHRIAIVRYPSRAAFFAMQQRDDFKSQHKHKDAGMEFTIVMGTAPDGGPARRFDKGSGSSVLVRLRRGSSPAPDPAGTIRLARLVVEGVIVGDERTWDEVLFDAVPEGTDVAAMSAIGEGTDEVLAVVVRPMIDDLAASFDWVTPA